MRSAAKTQTAHCSNCSNLDPAQEWISREKSFSETTCDSWQSASASTTVAWLQLGTALSAAHCTGLCTGLLGEHCSIPKGEGSGRVDGSLGPESPRSPMLLLRCPFASHKRGTDADGISPPLRGTHGFLSKAFCRVLMAKNVVPPDTRLYTDYTPFLSLLNLLGYCDLAYVCCRNSCRHGLFPCWRLAKNSPTKITMPRSWITFS